MTSIWKGVCAAAAICAATAAVDAVQQQAAARGASRSSRTTKCKVWKSIIMPNQPLSLHRHDHGRTIVRFEGRHARRGRPKA